MANKLDAVSSGGFPYFSKNLILSELKGAKDLKRDSYIVEQASY